MVYQGILRAGVVAIAVLILFVGPPARRTSSGVFLRDHS